MAELKKLDEIIEGLEQSTKDMKNLNEVIQEMESIHEIVRWTEEKAVEHAKQLDKLFPRLDASFEGYNTQFSQIEKQINEILNKFTKLQRETETATSELKKANEDAFANHKKVLDEEAKELNTILKTNFNHHISDMNLILEEAKNYQLKKINELSEQLLELEEGVSLKFESQESTLNEHVSFVKSKYNEVLTKLINLDTESRLNNTAMKEKIDLVKTNFEESSKGLKKITLWLGASNLTLLVVIGVLLLIGG